MAGLWLIACNGGLWRCNDAIVIPVRGRKGGGLAAGTDLLLIFPIIHYPVAWSLNVSSHQRAGGGHYRWSLQPLLIGLLCRDY